MSEQTLKLDPNRPLSKKEKVRVALGLTSIVSSIGALISGHIQHQPAAPSFEPAPLERPAPKPQVSESHISRMVTMPSHEEAAAVMANARHSAKPVQEVGPNGPMTEQFGGHPSQPTNQIK